MLIDYCGQDTWVMVEMVWFIGNLYLPKKNPTEPDGERHSDKLTLEPVDIVCLLTLCRSARSEIDVIDARGGIVLFFYEWYGGVVLNKKDIGNAVNNKKLQKNINAVAEQV